ncbi:MAG TPA: energy transducer TonB [Pyrinomonadaceae bacterium]|nr:energy transducer TonB [Pyrinomonadaceae bacterium]
MCCFALRLVVALLTFGVGIAASSLLNFNSSRKPHRCAAPAPAAVLVGSPSLEEPPPPPRASGCRLLNGKPCVLSVSAGVLDGKAISKPEPVYPPIAKASGAQGSVKVQVLVDEDGDVISAQALSGHPLLQQAAVAAALQAKLSPTLLSGQPARVSGTLTYNFALE